MEICLVAKIRVRDLGLYRKKIATKKHKSTMNVMSVLCLLCLFVARLAEASEEATHSFSGSDFKYSTRSCFSCVVNPRLNRVL